MGFLPFNILMAWILSDCVMIPIPLLVRVHRLLGVVLGAADLIPHVSRSLGSHMTDKLLGARFGHPELMEHISGCS